MSNDKQENTEVRAAAFALFGDLAAFGSGTSKEQFLDQIHTNFVSFLLHLNDHENQVRQVQNCLICLVTAALLMLRLLLSLLVFNACHMKGRDSKR